MNPTLNQPHIQGPISNTKTLEPVYYRCSLLNASMHRPDGKRLPFINGFFKATMKEDIEYLEEQLTAGSQYISRCTAEQVQLAKMNEDPIGTLRESVAKDVVANLTTDSLEALLAERKAGGGATVTPKVGAAANAALAAAKMAAARAATEQARIKPASTADIAGAAESNSKAG